MVPSIGLDSLLGLSLAPKLFREVKSLACYTLLGTKGDATIECDNKSVFKTFSKGPSAKPIYHSGLWHAAFCVVKERADLVFGTLNIEWIK